MLRLTFRPVNGDSTLSTRAAYFRFCADGTLRGSDNSIAAVYVDNYWRAGQRRFRGFECPGPVSLRVKKTANESPVQLGPYNLVRTAEGKLYADDVCLWDCVPAWGASADTIWHEITLLSVAL